MPSPNLYIYSTISTSKGEATQRPKQAQDKLTFQVDGGTSSKALLLNELQTINNEREREFVFPKDILLYLCVTITMKGKKRPLI